MGDLIRFDGRMNRGTYWKYTLGMVAAYFVAMLLWVGSADEYTGEPGGVLMFLGVVVWLAMIPISISANIRRWHDHNKSGWWMFISLVPFIGGLYALVMCLFVSGTPGPNTYGPPQGALMASAHGVA